MRRGNRDGRTQTKFVEFGGDTCALHAFGFVHQQQHRTPGLAQLGGNDVVLRRQPVATVDDEQHHIRLVHRLPRLLGHLVQDAFLGHRLQTAGIHHQIGPLADAPATVVAIAGQSRQIRHQRITAAREAVEQCGFTDVGTSDQYESR